MHNLSGLASRRLLMSVVWKRGWMVMVLIEIGLREIISQQTRRWKRSQGKQVVSRFPARRGPE